MWLEKFSLGVLARLEREGAELAALAFRGGLSSPGSHLGAQKYPQTSPPEVFGAEAAPILLCTLMVSGHSSIPQPPELLFLLPSSSLSSACGTSLFHSSAPGGSFSFYLWARDVSDCPDPEDPGE